MTHTRQVYSAVKCQSRVTW